MIFPRESAMAALREALDDNAATVLLGPRQIGKTTLAHAVAAERPDSVYLDLESDPDVRKLEDASAYLRTTAGRLTVID